MLQWLSHEFNSYFEKENINLFILLLRFRNIAKASCVQGSSSDRRSHDGGHYGGSYSGRQEGYGGERRSFGGEDRRRSPPRESYRKTSGMGPPREPPRSAVRPRAPRRAFRGRTLRSRASYRGAPRSRGSFTSRRFADRSLAYTRAFRSVKGRRYDTNKRLHSLVFIGLDAYRVLIQNKECWRELLRSVFSLLGNC